VKFDPKTITDPGTIPCWEIMYKQCFNVLDILIQAVVNKNEEGIEYALNAVREMEKVHTRVFNQCSAIVPPTSHGSEGN